MHPFAKATREGVVCKGLIRVDVSDFPARGRGRGSQRRQEWGGSVSHRKFQEGEGSPRKGPGGGLAEGHECDSLRWAKTRVLKNGHMRVETRVLKHTSVFEMVFGPLLSNGRQRVGAFLKTRVSKQYF